MCAAALFLACSAALKGSQLVMLDVGQGDAFLIRSEGAAVLVDTGTNDSLLRQAIARQGVLQLDAVVITHSDDDHCGSLAALGSIVRIDRIIVADGALTCPCDSCASLRGDAVALVGEQGMQGAAKGDALNVGAFSLEVVWPDGYEEEGGNADSLCLLLRYATPSGNLRALLTGDAEAEQLEEIARETDIEDLDVYKVGHHGSKNALSTEQAAELSPRISLVSVGESNRYGHPNAAVIAALEDAGSQVYRTDEQGDVSCSFTPEGIRVSTLR